jgi:hypothetical protein
MEQNGVAGTLPYELGRLQNLRRLILEEGILTGTIPTELGEVRTLQQIDLNFNLLQGPIPEQLYQLTVRSFSGRVEISINNYHLKSVLTIPFVVVVVAVFGYRILNN